MRGHCKLAGAAVAFLHYATTNAALTLMSTGANDDIRFQWGVPEAVASSGSGNTYFQLEAPGSYAWIGLGIGSAMRGAQMFIMYTDGDGNVTLSTREGAGHVLPDHVERSDTELLAGSGVVDGKMIANVRCGDCRNLDLTGTNGWIAAWMSGNAIDSADVNHAISQHDGHTQMRVNFGDARISSDENPFLANSDEDKGAPDRTGPKNAGNSSSGNGGGGGSNTDTIILAHGIVMLLVFAFMYPLGAILMPLVGKWYVHSMTQNLGWLAMWAAFGLGYIAASRQAQLFNQTHTILGTVVIALLGIQPILGWLHHRHFTAHQKRGIISHIHIWYGRILMALGVINGGFGIKLASASLGFKIAYIVVAAVMFTAYIACIAYGMIRNKRHVSSEKMSPARSAEENMGNAAQ